MHATAQESGVEAAPPPVRLSLPLRLAPGTQLLGQYESSAFSQPQYLVQRGDTQILQIGQLAYALATAIDGAREGPEIASAMSATLGRPVSVDNVAYLVEHKLGPLGILATEGAATALTRVNPLLGLRFRARVVPERLHRGATWLLRPLFRAPVVCAVLFAVAAVNAWVFTSNRRALVLGTRDLVLHPALLLLVIGLTVAAGAFHELGHATAARYGGAKPGVMGVGIYLMMPAFYTDVSDSYRLNRRGRLRTDLGGVYFNAITIVLAAVAYAATGSRALLVFIVLSEIEVLYQFLPFVRMDGYYVVADLIGVPNLFAFVAPVIASVFRRHDPSRQRLQVLTKRTRIAIRTWVGLTVPILAFDVFLFVMLAPHFFPGMWHSAQLFEKSAAYNLGRGSVVAGLDNIVQLVFLAIPAVGFSLMVGMLGGRLLRWAGAPVVRPVRDHPRWVFATLAVAAALLIAFIIPGGRVGEPEMPAQVASGPRPAFQAPAPPMAIANGHGRPAQVFEVVVVGEPVTVHGAPAPGLPGTAPVPEPTGDGHGPVTAGQPSAAGAGATALVGVGPATNAGAPAPSVSATLSTPVAPVGATVATGGPAPVPTPGGSAAAPAPSVSATVSTPIAKVAASLAAPAPAPAPTAPSGTAGAATTSVTAAVSAPVSVAATVRAPTPLARAATSATTTATTPPTTSAPAVVAPVSTVTAAPAAITKPVTHALGLV